MPSPIALLLLAFILGCVNADPADTITDNDVAMLNKIGGTFVSLLNSVPNRNYFQFSVLYYADASVENVSPSSNLPGCYAQSNDPGHVFLTNIVQGYNIGLCPFVAARVIDSSQHTEQTIFGSLRTSFGFNCPTPASNMYLYSFNTPCSGTKYSSGCISKWIQLFVKTCCNKNRRLIIGYSKPYGDEAKSNQLIADLPNVAMIKLI